MITDYIDGIPVIALDDETLPYLYSQRRLPQETRRVSYLQFNRKRKLTEAEQIVKDNFMPGIDVPYIRESPGQKPEPFFLLDGRPFTLGVAIKKRCFLYAAEPKGVYRRTRLDMLRFGCMIVVPIAGTPNKTERNMELEEQLLRCMIRNFEEETGYKVKRAIPLIGRDLMLSSRRQIDSYQAYYVEIDESVERTEPTNKRVFPFYMTVEDSLQLARMGGIKSTNPDLPDLRIEGCFKVALYSALEHTGALTIDLSRV